MNETYFMHVCDYASVDENTKNLNIFGIFDAIKANAFPAVHPKFAVVVGFKNASPTDQQAEVLVKHGVSVIASAMTSVKPGKNRWIANFVNIIFPQEGTYTVEFVMNGKSVASTEISVKK